MRAAQWMFWGKSECGVCCAPAPTLLFLFARDHLNQRNPVVQVELRQLCSTEGVVQMLRNRPDFRVLISVRCCRARGLTLAQFLRYVGSRFSVDLGLLFFFRFCILFCVSLWLSLRPWYRFLRG